MGTVDDYIASVPTGANRTELDRLHLRILDLVPECGQGISYGMPCYLYRDRPIAAIAVTKRHLSWYPYSGRVIGQIPDLSEFSSTQGALHFTPEQPLTEANIRALLVVKMSEIDAKLDAASS